MPRFTDESLARFKAALDWRRVNGESVVMMVRTHNINATVLEHIEYLLDTSSSSPRISEHSAKLREQMAAARMRCALLHELDLEARDVPCAACRQRGAEMYPVSDFTQVTT